MSTPFFYIIQQNKSGKYYAGSKFGKDADPLTFMTEDGYKTSSNIIHNFIMHDGIESFTIRKIRTFELPNDAYEYESRFLQKVKARTNKMFLNAHENDGLLPSYGSEKYKEFMIKKYGVDHPSKSKEIMQKSSESQSKLKQSKEWKTETEPKRIEKFLKSMNYKLAKKKEKETKSDPNWIEKIWNPAIEKRVKKLVESGKYKEIGSKCSQTKNSEEWKLRIGNAANEKHSKTINSEEWQSTVGVIWKNKMKETRNDPEWKKRNSITCEFCGKISDSGNYKKWHGINCKHKT